MSFWWLYFGLLAVAALILWFCEQSAAMRGTKGTPLPKWVDSSVRVVSGAAARALRGCVRVWLCTFACA